jgi:23S rRNA pseudouridine1911/1915/1917 synthase
MDKEVMAGILTGVTPVAGQGILLSKARTLYLKNHARHYTKMAIWPKTGRTHQIRVHLKHIGHPVVSDLIYTPKRLLAFDLLWCPRLFLHASSLAFNHPQTNKRVEFASDLPKGLKDAMLNLVKI